MIIILLFRVVSENGALEQIEAFAFCNLTELQEMYIAALHVEITSNHVLVETLESNIAVNIMKHIITYLSTYLTEL